MLLQELQVPIPLENEQKLFEEQLVESVHAFEFVRIALFVVTVDTVVDEVLDKVVDKVASVFADVVVEVVDKLVDKVVDTVVSIFVDCCDGSVVKVLNEVGTVVSIFFGGAVFGGAVFGAAVDGSVVKIVDKVVAKVVSVFVDVVVEVVDRVVFKDTLDTCRWFSCQGEKGSWYGSPTVFRWCC